MNDRDKRPALTNKFWLLSEPENWQRIVDKAERQRAERLARGFVRPGEHRMEVVP